jgi:predicted transcriptional regulator
MTPAQKKIEALRKQIRQLESQAKAKTRKARNRACYILGGAALRSPSVLAQLLPFLSAADRERVADFLPAEKPAIAPSPLPDSRPEI